jgi:antibiotic biosynthesis monooxygenase (ABM) superfamily enzyme
MVTSNRVKLSLLVWIAVYPVVTGLAFLSATALADSPLALRTLVMSAVMVPLMTFLIIPHLMRIFGKWLSRSPDRSAAAAQTQRKLQAWIDDMAACPH